MPHCRACGGRASAWRPCPAPLRAQGPSLPDARLRGTPAPPALCREHVPGTDAALLRFSAPVGQAQAGPGKAPRGGKCWGSPSGRARVPSTGGPAPAPPSCLPDAVAAPGPGCPQGPGSVWSLWATRPLLRPPHHGTNAAKSSTPAPRGGCVPAKRHRQSGQWPRPQIPVPGPHTAAAAQEPVVAESRPQVPIPASLQIVTQLLERAGPAQGLSVPILKSRWLSRSPRRLE